MTIIEFLKVCDFRTMKKFDSLTITLMKLNLTNHINSDLGDIARLATQCNIKQIRLSNEEKDLECQI